MNAESASESPGAARKISDGGHPPGRKPPGGQRRSPKTVVGQVASDKMQKTRTVQVQRLVKHPKYGKYTQSRSK